ncbi:MAG: hypothetical protein ACT4OJ_12295 [Bacteroidota bacterium]
MEVHHHSHIPMRREKKWTHYFWEFFMLFLAVSAGFFAENLREHRIENKREKKLVRVLLGDLEADVLQIDSLIKRRTSRNTDCDSLIKLLIAPSRQKGRQVYFYGRNASRRIHFRPQDGTLQQLRNSGGFRVVHNDDILARINSYELLLKHNLENIEVEEKELSEYTAVAAKVFNVAVFQQMTKNNTVEPPDGNPVLLTYDKQLLNELSLKLHYWKRTSLSVLSSWDDLRKRAIRLIEDIKKEYHLE